MLEWTTEKGDEGMKGKVDLKKEDKKQRLLEAAYGLFCEKGFRDTTIQNIVDQAGVAKGTFYLYFKDRYDIQEHVIATQSYQLFQHAIESIAKNQPQTFEERVIMAVDHIVDELLHDRDLLHLIRKNLSSGLFEPKLVKLLEEQNSEFITVFLRDAAASKIPMKNPKITLFMIVELAGSSCYNCIIHGQPLTIETYRPFLHQGIKAILHMDEL